MANFKRVKSETFEGGADQLRPAIEAMRSLETTPVEREFRPKWALDLKRRIEKGQAIPFLWAVADVPVNGDQVRMRINGGHSSWALEQLLNESQAGKKAMPEDLAIHLDTYEVVNQDGAVELFRQFDARTSARTKEDICGAYQCFHPVLRACDRKVQKSVIEGVVWFRRVVEGSAVPSGDDVYLLNNEARLHPFFLMMNGVLGHKKANELKKVPLLAAAYGTWLDDAKRAEPFWRDVAAGSNCALESAATDLSAEILRILETREKVSDRDLYARAVKSWNAFLNGVRVNNFKVNTRGKSLPKLGNLTA